MSKTPDHYNMEIQPIEFIVKNNIPFREANIIKYVCRHRDKDGIDDLLKAQHYLQMLIDEWEAENEEFKTPTLAEQLAEQEKKKQEKIAANKDWDAIVKANDHKRRESIEPDEEIEQLENLKAGGINKRKGKIEQAFTRTVIIGRK
jgi:hypothetical protein